MKTKSTPPAQTALLAIAHAAAANALNIARELPDGWIERNSVFSPESGRVEQSAAFLALVEQGAGFWEENEADWETVCGRLAVIVAEEPPQTITLARVRAALGSA